jgi:hypothetical protein
MNQKNFILIDWIFKKLFLYYNIYIYIILLSKHCYKYEKISFPVSMQLEPN